MLRDHIQVCLLAPLEVSITREKHQQNVKDKQSFREVDKYLVALLSEKFEAALIDRHVRQETFLVPDELNRHSIRGVAR